MIGSGMWLSFQQTVPLRAAAASDGKGYKNSGQVRRIYGYGSTTDSQTGWPPRLGGRASMWKQ
jgi:hypothetical protein